MEIGQRMVEGLGAAAWVIGLMAGLGVILLIVGTIGYALMSVFGAEDEEEEEEEEEEQ